MPASTPFPPLPSRVVFTVEDDEDAARIKAVLHALGYAVTRAIPASDYDPKTAQLRALVSVSRMYGLCPRSQQMLAAIVDGKDSRDEHAVALGVDARTCKWLRHVLISRLNVEDNAGIRELVTEHRDLVLESPTPCEYLAEGAAPS